MKRLAAYVFYVAYVLTSTAGAQELPKTPPAPLPLTPAPFPPFQEGVLPNGVRLLVVENRKQPIVSISLSFPGGNRYDPAGKEGLADMVAGLLTKGAGQRNAEQISDAIEGAGGSLGAGAGSDFLSISATVLTPSLPLAFELVRDAVARPTFPESELELLRTQSLSGLQVQLSQPGVIASRVFRRELYGSHPYGASASPASIKAITRADLLAFHRDRLRPSGALLVLAGDIDLATATRLASSAFKGWTGTPKAVAAPSTPPARTASEIILVHRPGSVQSNILAGNLTFNPNDQRWYAARIANKVLGGGADSRLFMILREEKSWTYGAYSDLERRLGIGSFVANAEVRTEVTDSALAELLHQLRRIGSEPVPAAELDAAKGALVGSYPLTIQTADQVADAVGNARLMGMPADYIQTYRLRLGAVTAEQATAAARAAIRPDQLVIVVVGDAQKVYDRIKGLAPTRVVDIEGKPLALDDLNPKAQSIDFDLAALVPRRDSLAIMVQGAQLGWLRGVLEKTPDGFRYVEDTRIANFVSQTTTLDLDAKAEMKHIAQQGMVQGIAASINVAFGGGRAKGDASTPGQDGQIKTIAIDTTFAPGTLDDNAVQALLPAFRWAPAAKWTFQVLSTGQGEFRTMTLAVTGTETLTIGGQTFECYTVELTGGQQPVNFWISTAAPHRLMKLTVAGAPIEMIRAN
jgi:zinc protease